MQCPRCPRCKKRTFVIEITVMGKSVFGGKKAWMCAMDMLPFLVKGENPNGRVQATAKS